MNQWRLACSLPNMTRAKKWGQSYMSMSMTGSCSAVISGQCKTGTPKRNETTGQTRMMNERNETKRNKAQDGKDRQTDRRTGEKEKEKGKSHTSLTTNPE